ncbi:MAG: cytochrome c biogenesis protein ResB [Candidatus Electryonea clarkiae]|nr:cytochrome c biogenesis protein ResB [Candidatus Electryonea clarkiae]MDP8285159.1 cytochrome c biogenesis protein ResB [Candidatus Electryonea clarkiae]
MSKEDRNNSSSGSFDAFFDKTWILFKSMKFAIILLIIFAVLSIFNLFAQEFIIEVQGGSDRAHLIYQSEYGETRASVLMFFQMYNPYRSWWYSLMLGLLTLSLTICVIDRAPNVYNQVFRPRYLRDPKNYKSSKISAMIKGKDGVDQTIDKVLKKNGYKVWQEQTEKGMIIDGEKFVWARSGSWFVHIGFIFLIIGGLLIARSEYRVHASGFPGELLAKGEDQWGFNVLVEDFIIEYYPLAVGQVVEVNRRVIGRLIEKNSDGSFNVESYRPASGILPNIAPENISNKIDWQMDGGRIDQANISDYIAFLTIIENGKQIDTRRVEVNAPLRHKGFRFYQSSFDANRTNADGKWTTVLEVRKDGGSPFIWVGIILFTLGIVVSMYLTPRRINALIEKDGTKIDIYLAGRSVKNQSLFKNEFKRIVKKIQQNLKTDEDK